MHHHHHHHPEGVVYRGRLNSSTVAVNSSTVAVSEIASRWWWWWLWSESLFPGDGHRNARQAIASHGFCRRRRRSGRRGNRGLELLQPAADGCGDDLSGAWTDTRSLLEALQVPAKHPALRCCAATSATQQRKLHVFTGEMANSQIGVWQDFSNRTCRYPG